MILTLMAEHDYSKPVHITKFGDSMTAVPSETVQPDAAPILHRVLRVLDETLGNENPTLYSRRRGAVEKASVRPVPFYAEVFERRFMGGGAS